MNFKAKVKQHNKRLYLYVRQVKGNTRQTTAGYRCHLVPWKTRGKIRATVVSSESLERHNESRTPCRCGEESFMERRAFSMSFCSCSPAYWALPSLKRVLLAPYIEEMQMTVKRGWKTLWNSCFRKMDMLSHLK